MLKRSMQKCALLAVAALALPVAAIALAGGDDEPKETVTFAKSWEAAVEEAKALNLPLVVHSHGFY